MAASRWPAVVDALIAVLSADASLTGLVYDGVPVTSDDIRSGVFIGVLLEDPGNSGQITQDYHELGSGAKRDEEGVVRCTVLSQSGDIGIAAHRTTAFTLLGHVERVVRGNYSLGLADVLYSEVRIGHARQAHTPRGSYVEVEFQITYKALL